MQKAAAVEKSKKIHCDDNSAVWKIFWLKFSVSVGAWRTLFYVSVARYTWDWRDLNLAWQLNGVAYAKDFKYPSLNRGLDSAVTWQEITSQQ